MIQRDLTKHVKRLAKTFYAVSITGPRQSGKTTLARSTFPKYLYINLEALDMRTKAQEDPRQFLDDLQKERGVILDEIQYVPDLFSYLQVYIDEYKKPGFYILSGSQNFLLLQSITQSLAGRVANLTLLPLSTSELAAQALLPDSALDALFNGWYPSVYSRKTHPYDWYQSYIDLYIERDVRSIKNITDLALFKKFIGLCAGRIGQLVNVTSLANDCGITVATANAWLSVLEASYIIFFLQPHYNNFSKRLIKSPKLYFYDTGIACNLLEISSARELEKHYLRGGLFESMVIGDMVKQQVNRAMRPKCFFWRDKTGHEVDCLIERGQSLFPIEIKAGKTINSNFFDGLNFWNKLADADPKNSFIVYAGNQEHTWHDVNIVNWQSCRRVIERVFGTK